MRKTFTILIFLLAVHGHAQTIAIASGLNYGRFYDLRPNEGHFYKDYQAQFGSSFGAEVKDIAIDTSFKVGVAINYQNYGGYFLTRDGGMGGSITTQGQISKHVIGLELYPLHMTIHRHLRLNLGISYNRLIQYKLSGTKSWWYGTGPPLNTGTSDLNDLENFVKPYNWGLISSLGYEYTIGKIKIEPRYCYYFGVSTVFNRLQAATSSMRHNLVLSIGYSSK